MNNATWYAIGAMQSNSEPTHLTPEQAQIMILITIMVFVAIKLIITYILWDSAYDKKKFWILYASFWGIILTSGLIVYNLIF